ncbi:MAG: DUF4956 domain-containing protein [Verrucomicrobiota bacterium]|jgi:hypothetical protein
MNDLLSAITRSDLAGTADPLSVIFIIVMAFIAGVAIGFIYMWTHESLSYSRNFVGSLAILPVLVAMTMVAMANSIAVAFGMLGVFGVIRFRNVLKDTRDTSFILWAVMEGMALGTMRFSTALMALLGVSAAYICLRFMSFGLRRRYDAVLTLRLNGDVPSRLQTLAAILKRHARRLDLASDRRTIKEGTDLSYRLLLRNPSRSSELQTELVGTEGFENVSIYLHDDEAEI